MATSTKTMMPIISVALTLLTSKECRAEAMPNPFAHEVHEEAMPNPYILEEAERAVTRTVEAAKQEKAWEEFHQEAARQEKEWQEFQKNGKESAPVLGVTLTFLVPTHTEEECNP